MAKRHAPPELTFQEHIADYLVREHGYGVLEQAEITDTENAIAEDHLWTFLCATQAETVKRLQEDYGTDARDEIFRALRKALKGAPLWMILRHGLTVRGLEFKLYIPRPRSSASAAHAGYPQNRVTFRPHFYFGEAHNEVDFVLFLNGLPIVALELKHEKNQNVHDAVAQFAARDHAFKIFQHPFLYLAADTSDVMAATDPRREQNFRWHNTGLTNAPQSPDEYPVEFFYREVLSKERLIEALDFFLLRVPHQDAEGDKPEVPAHTIFPRYHQSRMVRRVAGDALGHFASTGEIGKKYLINHSAGSGKTLSICWLADRLDGLFKPGSDEKLTDVIFIVTDRKSLDTNIREDIAKFTHLKDKVGLARKSDDLASFLKSRTPIIVTTQQKFVWVLQKLESDPALKNLRVAFLIDEAHRSQEGEMGVAIRTPFRTAAAAHPTAPTPPAPSAAPDETAPDDEETIAKIIREHDRNQLFVAFTATPAQATLDLFGDPFDTYTEAEAIAEGYIVDVAASIISYKTLYNLHCAFVPPPDQERTFPKGVVAKALQNVAFQDEGLIQYKAEVMLRIFEKDVMNLIGGRAKAMIVATSRVAGLLYFNLLKEKIKERGASYKVLYAFSDFVHPETNEPVSEHAVNGLKDGELIEDRFSGDDYRLMVVANKFQTGFDEPLLAGMFLDKTVSGRNAVQTVSRLNRKIDGKKEVVVVDFTNNADEILKAFAKYRKGTPFKPDPPDPQLCLKLHADILEAGVFDQTDAHAFVALAATGTDAQVQYMVNTLRVRFQNTLAGMEDRKAFVYLLARFVKCVRFMTCFYRFPEPVKEFVEFADYVGPQLIKQGSVSELMLMIRQTEVVKAAVQYQGVRDGVGDIKVKPGSGKKGMGPPPKKITVQDMIADLRKRYEITDDEALYIRQATELKAADPVIRDTVQAHSNDLPYLEGPYRVQINGELRQVYTGWARFEELADAKYTAPGGIFDCMAITVIQTNQVA